jgi:hypothetical protein
MQLDVFPLSFQDSNINQICSLPRLFVIIIFLSEPHPLGLTNSLTILCNNNFTVLSHITQKLIVCLKTIYSFSEQGRIVTCFLSYSIIVGQSQIVFRFLWLYYNTLFSISKCSADKSHMLITHSCKKMTSERPYERHVAKPIEPARLFATWQKHIIQ